MAIGRIEMRTRVIAWGADDAPDIDAIYDEGVSTPEMANLLQTYPNLDFALLPAEPEGESA